MEFRSLKMGIFIVGNTNKISLRVKVNMYGKIPRNMKENSDKAEEMDQAFGSHPIKLMLKFIKESI